MEFRKIALYMALLFVFSVSCKKDEPPRPAYIGTWTALKFVPVAGEITPVMDVMSFTERSFFDVMQLQLPDDQWTDYISMKGSVSVQGNRMSLAITEAGIFAFDPETGLPTGVVTRYKAGSTELDLLLSVSGQPKAFESEFSVAANKLTLVTDYNVDGVFGDEFETTVYTRLQ